MNYEFSSCINLMICIGLFVHNVCAKDSSSCIESTFNFKCAIEPFDFYCFSNKNFPLQLQTFPQVQTQYMLKSSITIIALFSNVQSHSWVRCTDYDAAINGADYNEDNCLGWIRDWQFSGIEFGVDRGTNFIINIGSGSSICGRNQMEGSPDSDYSADYANSDKLARYTSGSTVRVVWPAKNHANYECSSNIPDTSMKLFMNPNVNPTSDLSNTQGSMEANGWTLVKDWQEGCTPGTDGCGFQNCPKFCENTDKATCYGDFTVPTVTTSGYYTFVWYWIFNPGDPYISCWEAYIDANGQTTTV